MTDDTLRLDPIVLCMRWFGPDDPVSLAHIAQVPGMRGIVSALSSVPTGSAWPRGEVARLREAIEASGLRFEVVESIAVSDEIKLAGADAASHTDAWCESLAAVAEQGVKTVCYNFMPVSDWVRTELAMPLPDGSTTLAYAEADMADFERRIYSGATQTLPAWDHVDIDGFASLRERYTARGEEGLWDALAAFLEKVVPAAESLGVRIALHPDDPCWPVLGLPRIIRNGKALKRVCSLADSPANGLTLCTGSLGCDPANDMVAIAREVGSRVAFVHARNVKTTAPQTFHESAHPRAFGDIDLPGVLAALIGAGFEGPIRPDHGRMIWGETGKPGYGLFDRALGAMYLSGAIDTLRSRT